MWQVDRHLSFCSNNYSVVPSRNQNIAEQKMSEHQVKFSILKSSTERESLGAGATGGAAVGAVIAIAAASTSVMIPVIGAVVGALGGAALGHIANTYIARSSETERENASKS